MTSGTSAISSTTSAGTSGNGQARSPKSTVSTVASDPLQRLDQLDRSGRASPKLQGRAESSRGRSPTPPLQQEPMALDVQQEPMDLDVRVRFAHEIEHREVTPMFREWLIEQGWSAGDLVDLDEQAAQNNPELQDQFMVTLCEQAASNRNGLVFRLVPEATIANFEDDLDLCIRTYEGLLLLVPPRGAADPAAAPVGSEEVPFLSRQEREARRGLYFPGEAVQMTPALREWLLGQNFEKYLQDLDNTPEDEIVGEIVNYAIELEQYEVIQSIPRDHADIVREYVQSAIDYKNGMLEFIQQQDEVNL